MHNGVIKGGSRYCASHCPGDWCSFVRVTGFSTWNECLSFEWNWKHVSKYRRGQDPSRRRLANLDVLMKRPRWAAMKLSVETVDDDDSSTSLPT